VGPGRDPPLPGTRHLHPLLDGLPGHQSTEALSPGNGMGIWLVLWVFSNVYPLKHKQFAALLVACICVQFIICGWSLAMRENLPTSVEIFIDDSFVEFLDKFSRTKVDNLHLWNRMQSQVSQGCLEVEKAFEYCGKLHPH